MKMSLVSFDLFVQNFNGQNFKIFEQILFRFIFEELDFLIQNDLKITIFRKLLLDTIGSSAREK